MTKYAENMKKYVGNVEICGKYEEISGKYEEIICRNYEGVLHISLDFLHISSSSWDLEKFRAFSHYIRSGSPKNSESLLPVEAVELIKILREAWLQDSKDIEHDLYFLLVKSFVFLSCSETFISALYRVKFSGNSVPIFLYTWS